MHTHTYIYTHMYTYIHYMRTYTHQVLYWSRHWSNNHRRLKLAFEMWRYPCNIISLGLWCKWGGMSEWGMRGHVSVAVTHTYIHTNMYTNIHILHTHKHTQYLFTPCNDKVWIRVCYITHTHTLIFKHSYIHIPRAYSTSPGLLDIPSSPVNTSSSLLIDARP